LEGKQSLIPEFCFSQDRIINTHFIKKNKDQVLILDFLHAFANNIIEAIVDVPTLKVLIDAPMEVRFRRRIKRDIQERGKTLEQALMEWKLIEKSEKVFILDMKKKADIIFYNA
jgi:uridine kinase